MIDSSLYAKSPPQLKWSHKLAYLETGTYGQIVAHLEEELEPGGLGKDGELSIPTIAALISNDNQQNIEKSKIICHYCKKPVHAIRDCRKK